MTEERPDGIRVWRAGGRVPAQGAPSGLIASMEAEALDARGEARRWAAWVVEMGYPFNFSIDDAAPEPDMLAAIAEAWHQRPDGFAGESMEDTILSVCYEAGAGDQIDAALLAWEAMRDE